jgi:hypothetical protein
MMKSLQNNILRNDWPMVAPTTKNVYLCPEIIEEMNEETFVTEPDNEELKPYTMEEIYAMVKEGERDIREGRVFSTEEVIEYCKKELAELTKP